jgi:hypothetical protein
MSHRAIVTNSQFLVTESVITFTNRHHTLTNEREFVPDSQKFIPFSLIPGIFLPYSDGSVELAVNRRQA